MRTNIIVASLLMIAITLLLFFLPFVNGLIGGAVGGYKVGTAKRGFIAAMVPAVVVAFGVWVLLIAFELPVVGLLAGVGAGILIIFADVGLVIGAAIGGYVAQSRHRVGHLT